MLGLPSRGVAYLVAVVGGVAILIALVVWLRWDAVQDERARNKLGVAEGRIETLTNTKERRNDVEILSDDDLRHRLFERVPGINQPSRPF